MFGRLRQQAATVATSCSAKAGYALIPQWRLPALPFAAHLATLFDRYHIDCVFDVGANDGGYGRFLRNEVGYRGLLLSFEPISWLAAQCRDAAADDPDWVVLDYAAGDQDTEARINVARNSKFSSLLSAVSTPPVAGFAGHIETSSTEVVSVHRLDTVLPPLQRDHGFQRPYLKVDTQGYDLAVLAGAGARLADFAAVQTEMALRPIYQDAPDWRQILDALEQRGFAVSNMFTVNLDAAMRAIEFDCIAVNERFADAV